MFGRHKENRAGNSFLKSQEEEYYPMPKNLESENTSTENKTFEENMDNSKERELENQKAPEKEVQTYAPIESVTNEREVQNNQNSVEESSSLKANTSQNEKKDVLEQYIDIKQEELDSKFFETDFLER